MEALLCILNIIQELSVNHFGKVDNIGIIVFYCES